MELRKISATRRAMHGGSASRRLRREGKIPAVAYGPQLKAQALAVSPKDLVDVLGSALGRNTLLELEVEGGDKLTVLLSDFQYHPLSRALLHADFLQIDVTQPVDVEVPFELTGKPAGVVMGGVLRQVFRKLPVRCLPDRIPVKIEHDVTELSLGEHLSVQELALPEGVAVRLEPTRTIAGVAAPEKREAEAEEAAAAAPGAAPAGEAPAETATPGGA